VRRAFQYRLRVFKCAISEAGNRCGLI
jgi:hypothetical protein